MGADSESGSTSYVSIGVKLLDKLLVVGKHGIAYKDQDTFNQECKPPYDFTNVCGAPYVIDNSFKSNFYEGGIDLLIVDEERYQVDFEVTYMKTNIDKEFFNEGGV